MKKLCEIIIKIIDIVFGYGIMLSLFLGGMAFFGYVAALIAGGQTAELICEFIYKTFYPYLIYFSSVIVIVGLFKEYIKKLEQALEQRYSI